MQSIFKLRSDSNEKLRLLADELKQDKAELVQRAVDEFMERQQTSLNRWDEPRVALTNIEDGKVVGGEKVKAWMRSWGTIEEEERPK